MGLTTIDVIGIQHGQWPDQWTGGVDLVGVQVAKPESVEDNRVMLLGMQYAIRADRTPSGQRLSFAFTDGAEDDQLIYQDVIFPECLSYGTTVSPTYSTDRVEVASGDEQRNARLDFPRHVYSVQMDNKTADEIADILNIWHVCKGSYAGFMFMDPHDMTSAWSEDLIASNVVSDTDQLVGLAEANTTKYNLYKTYSVGVRDVRRRIKYPKVDTLTVAINGFNNTQWSWSFASQQLQFIALTLSTFTGTISRASGGVYQGSPGDFFNFNAGDLVYVTGWSDGAYNKGPGVNPARVRSRSGDGSEMVVENFDGSDFGSATATDEEVTITPALPPSGSEITAGFWFYVPVRFYEEDNAEYEFTSGLRETAFADVAHITLRELLE